MIHIMVKLLFVICIISVAMHEPISMMADAFPCVMENCSATSISRGWDPLVVSNPPSERRVLLSNITKSGGKPGSDQDKREAYGIPMDADIIYFKNSSSCKSRMGPRETQAEISKLCDFLELASCTVEPFGARQEAERPSFVFACNGNDCETVWSEDRSLCTLTAMGLRVTGSNSSCSDIDGSTAPLWDIPPGQEQSLSCTLSLQPGVQILQSVHCVDGVARLSFAMAMDQDWVAPMGQYTCIFDFMCSGDGDGAGVSICHAPQALGSPPSERSWAPSVSIQRRLMLEVLLICLVGALELVSGW